MIRQCPAPGPSGSRLKEERQELVRQIATYEAELGVLPPENKTLREMRQWQIRRDQKRLAEVEARLGQLRERHPL